MLSNLIKNEFLLKWMNAFDSTSLMNGTWVVIRLVAKAPFVLSSLTQQYLWFALLTITIFSLFVTWALSFLALFWTTGRLSCVLDCSSRAGRSGFSRWPGYWVHCLKLFALLILCRPLVNTSCRFQSAHAIAFVILPSRRLSYVLMSRSICIFCLRVLQLTVLDVLLDSIVIMCVCWFVGLFLYSGHVLFRLYLDDWLSNPIFYSYFVVLILDFIISIGLHPILCQFFCCISLLIVHSHSDFILIGFLLLWVSALSLLDFISSEARKGVLRHN